MNKRSLAAAVLAFIAVFISIEGLYASEMWDALEMMQNNPDKGFEIAKNISTKELSDNGRFLKLVIIMSYEKITKEDFGEQIGRFTGLTVMSAAVKPKSIKASGEDITVKVDTYKKDVFLNLKLKTAIAPALLKNNENFFSFTGKIRKISKNGNGYDAILDDGGFQIVGGPDTVNGREMEVLRKYYMAENWKESSELSKKYMDRFLVGNNSLEYRLRFYYVHALAGLVAERKMTYEQFDDELKDFVGKVFELSRWCEACASISEDNPKETAIVYANDKGTVIHEFIRVVSRENAVIEDGYKSVSVQGILKSYELNPNKSNVWIVRLHLNPGEVIYGK